MSNDQNGMIFIPANYYNLLNEIEKLKKEKEDIESKKKYVDNLYNQLSLSVENYLAEIKKLKEERDLLNNIINDLNDKITNLENKNLSLNNKVTNLEKENAEIKINNISFNDRIIALEYKNLYNKFIIAIQDLNSHDKLEKKNINTFLKKLRNNRILDCHYIDDDYDDNIKNYRIHILYEKILNIPQFIENKFNTNYQNLLNDIKNYIKNDDRYNSLINIDEEDKDNAIGWWND